MTADLAYATCGIPDFEEKCTLGYYLSIILEDYIGK